MKKLLTFLAMTAFFTAVHAQLPTQDFGKKRAMWASIMTLSNASIGDDYTKHTNKLLISWRMLPTDTFEDTYDLFWRNPSSARMSKENKTLIKATNYQLTTTPTSSRMYYLVKGGQYELGLLTPAAERERIQNEIRATALDSLLLDDRVLKDKLPYVSIPLKTTEDCTKYPDYIKYQANDCSVADLDGDGEMEVVVKRLLTVYDASGTITASSEAAANTDSRANHVVIWDAYKLDGTMLWRVKSGPNIIAGNSSSVMLGDLDGDGCAEFVTKTGEGTVFGDGTEIGDTDNDGVIDYRNNWNGGHYIGDYKNTYGGPEYFSVIDGKTGREMARANFIARGPEGQTREQWMANWSANSGSWGDNYWKRANSFRMGLASFKGNGVMQVFLGRGVYGRTVVEGWEYTKQPDENLGLEGRLTRMWKLDTDETGHWTMVDGEWTMLPANNKDGKPNSAYAGQGNHAFNVADLDGDGKDEVMYGSCAFDDDGTGLWTTGLGHGDANHVGRFLPDREGLQVYHCLEGGKTEVALHDAKDGSTIWAIVAETAGDQGRCMTADVNPNSPGYEFWKYGNELFDQNGAPLMASDGTTRAKETSANAGIWFDGYLNRQMINEGIINSYSHGRTFTMYRYEGEASFNNSTKSNPGWYGDFLGDWREEFIVPDNTKLDHLNVFSTWYPSEYKLPYLMSDHTYYMQCLHENVGYNQPTNVGGYYLGSDMDFSKVPLIEAPETGIKDVKTQIQPIVMDKIYDLSGRQMDSNMLKKGLYVRNGKKFFVK